MSVIQTIQHKNLRWIDIHCNGGNKGKGIKYLEKNFNFHPLDLEDCVSITHRSKCDQYANYSFLILLFPTYDKTTREIKTTEIDFFISKDYLISFHRNNDLKLLQNFFKSLEKSEKEKAKYLNFPSERLLYEILNIIYSACFPMLGHINADLDHIEKQIFAGHEKEMVHEISVIRRNITDFRKIMQPHKNVLQKLASSLQESPLFEIKKTDVYYNNLIDYTKESWDALENYKERIEALQATNESLIRFKLNDIMKTLTIISVITFPVTLVAAVFGMNTTGSMPFIESPYGFTIVIGIMIAMAIFMLWHFKRRKWM